MKAEIAVIPGDGIGPEIAAEAQAVLQCAADLFGHHFVFRRLEMGGCSIDRYGEPLTEENLERAKQSDAVLLGAVGGDAETSPWYRLAPERRPEAGLLKIRKELGLFANLRPACLYPELSSACPLRQSAAERGFDLLIVRELTGGLYFGKRCTERVRGAETATDTLVYSELEIERVAEKAFEAAMGRKKLLTCVDKANVLDSSRLWRKVTARAAERYPEVKLSYMLVDNCAMQLIRDPAQFDVIVTENMFGDILSDEAGALTGSLGMLPSASLGEGGIGLYEPCHGSAPELAGKNIANPLAAILSAAMLLRYSLCLETEAEAVEKAVRGALRDGLRTADIRAEGEEALGTEEMGRAVRARIGKES